MARAADLWHDYRVLTGALAVSAALHAAVVAGIPGRSEALDDAGGPSYTATLDLPAPPGTTVEPVAKPTPRPPRRAAPHHHVKARAHPVLAATAPAAAAGPELPPADIAPAEPPREEPAAPPPPPPPAKPEQVAIAKPAAPVPALQAPVFPVTALPDHLSVSYALTSAFADGRATYDWTRDGDHYRIRSEAQAVGFFTL